MNNYFASDYQNFIYVSRYAKWLDEEKRRETWPETVSRYMDFMDGHLKRNFSYDMGTPLYDELWEGIASFQVMPSMRALMTAGPALERDNVAGYNCSYLAVDDIKAFDEALFILCCGTGVGFSVERQYVSKLPEIPDTLYPSDTVIAVKDSKEGWAKAYRQLIALLYSGEIPRWDVSRVRPAGARLKTFGGRASGPGPLEDLFRFTIDVFKGAAGRKLTSLEAHDLMCKIGAIVVVGGVRRSAMISLSNLSDDRMRDAKAGQWWEHDGHRALANNSVCYTDKPDVGAFLKEWYSLYMSKSGERGIFNRKASQKQASKNGRRDASYEFGTNPCCVTGITPILTKDGYNPIIDTVGKSVEIWNGEGFAEVVPYEAGVAEIHRVSFSDGTYLDCTEGHRFCIDKRGFVTTDELIIGDKLRKFDMPVVEGTDTPEGCAYSQGFYSGDGTTGYPYSFLYEPKYGCESRLKGTFKEMPSSARKMWRHGHMLSKQFVPLNASVAYCVDWLSGLLDADGCVTSYENGKAIQLVSVDAQFLSDLRLMLTRLGVQAKIVRAADAGSRSMPDGRGGSAMYMCQATQRILINCTDTVRLQELGLNTSRLDLTNNTPQRDARQFVKVVAIEDLGRAEMTYCFTEPKTSRGTFNGIVTGNSEIILRPGQKCNLSSTVVRATDTLESLKTKVRLVAILGTFQSTLTKFPYLRSFWRKNTEEERLLGVDLTGIMDCALTNGTKGNLAETLSTLREHAVEVNKEFAEAIGIPQSTAVTCNKPSGTVSQLVDGASGIHTRHSPYYIRTVRGDNKDPLTQFMKDAGVPNEPDVTKPDQTTVFSFPIKSPVGAITRNDLTAIQQLEIWKTYQEHWCEHKPSVTINVKEHEWPEVGGWVYQNFDMISGVSFLPHSDHTYRQAPYQECTKEEYEAAVAVMPSRIDWTSLAAYEAEDTTKGSQELACSAGGCDIVDI